MLIRQLVLRHSACHCPPIFTEPPVVCMLVYFNRAIRCLRCGVVACLRARTCQPAITEISNPDPLPSLSPKKTNPPHPAKKTTKHSHSAAQPAHQYPRSLCTSSGIYVTHVLLVQPRVSENTIVTAALTVLVYQYTSEMEHCLYQVLDRSNREETGQGDLRHAGRLTTTRTC